MNVACIISAELLEYCWITDVHQIYRRRIKLILSNYKTVKLMNELLACNDVLISSQGLLMDRLIPTVIALFKDKLKRMLLLQYLISVCYRGN